MSIEPLKYKSDWPQAVQRLMAWWDGEVIGRACIQVTAPRKGAKPMPANLQGRFWLDTERQLAQAEAAAERTCYLGEAFPCYWPNIGPETLAVYLGCRVEFSDRTSWTYPLGKMLDAKEMLDAARPASDTQHPASSIQHPAFPELRFDPSNRYYQWVKEATLAAMERFAGKIIVGVTDFHNAGDTLAAIRDPQQLCLDMIERPGQVKRAIEFLDTFRQRMFDESIAWTRPQGGTTTWLPGFSTGSYACTQVDFIVLIGPAMFREFVLDELNAAGRRADHVMYHLDGPGELKHLDDLLAMDNLHAIQWVPGAGGKPQIEWLDLLKRIRADGKSLHLWVDEPADTVRLVEELGPAGLILSTSTQTQAEGEQLVKDISRASARR